jgi:hypothetical protein
MAGGLTSGREEGCRRGLRERERHVQRRQPDLGAIPAAASAAACKHEATKSATWKVETKQAVPPFQIPEVHSPLATHLPSCPSPRRRCTREPAWSWDPHRAPEQKEYDCTRRRRSELETRETKRFTSRVQERRG